MAKRSGERRLNIKVGMDRSAYKAEAEKHKQEEKKRLQEMLTDEQVAERAKVMMIQETNRKRVQEAKKSAAEEGKGWLDVDKSISGAGDKLTSYLGGLAALSTAGTVVNQIAGYFDNIHRQTVDAALELTGYRAKLLELAALKDQMGQTGPELANQLRFRAQTLQSPDAAIAMQQSALGIGEIAIDKGKRRGKISRDDFQKLLASAGKMQTMEGGSPQAYGKLAGLVPLLSPEHIDAAQGEAKLDKLFKIQQPGGFPNFSQAIDQFGKLTGYIQTGQINDEEAMALLSAYSVASPESAGTYTEQAIRAVSAGVLRSRGMHISSDQDSVKTDQFFKEIGVTTKMGIRDRLMTTTKHLSGWMQKNPGLNVGDYLVTRGFGSQEERNSLQIMAGLHKEGNWQVFEDMLGKQGEAGAITKRFDEVTGSDKLMQDRRSQTMAELAKLDKGVGAERIMPLQRAAWAELKTQGKITDENFDEWSKRGMLGRMWDDFNPLWSNYHEQVNLRSQEAVVSEARRLGIPYTNPITVGRGGEPVQHYMGDEALGRLTTKVEQAGGDPLRVFGDTLSKLSNRVANSISPVPPPMQGTPPEIQTRP